MTVFETALPDFGVTVTVTLHEPALTPFSDVPLTLQYFAEEVATFRVMRAPLATVIFAYFAMDEPVAAFFADTTGATATDTVAPDPDAANGAVVAGAVVAGASVVAGLVVCDTTELGGAVVAGAAVVGAAVVGGAVVGAAVVGAALVVVAAARVTLNVYVVVDVPDTPFTANEMLSVAPSATLRVSTSDDMASVPNELVRLIAAPEDEASTVKSTDAEALGMLKLYVVTAGLNAGERDPALTVTESSVETPSIARAARPSAAATPPMLVLEDPMNTRLSLPLYDMSASRAFTTAGLLRPMPCQEDPVHRATPPDVPVTPGNDPPTNS